MIKNNCWWLKSGVYQFRLVVYPIIYKILQGFSTIQTVVGNGISSINSTTNFPILRSVPSVHPLGAGRDHSPLPLQSAWLPRVSWCTLVAVGFGWRNEDLKNTGRLAYNHQNHQNHQHHQLHELYISDIFLKKLIRSDLDSDYCIHFGILWHLGSLCGMECLEW